MNKDLLIVASIIKVLESSDQSASEQLEDLAVKYVELCVNVNHVLHIIDNYISNSMYDEAISLAYTPPFIANRIGVLMFEGMDEWKEICEEYGYPSPPEFSTSALDRLEQIQDSQNNVAPYLKAYNSIARKGTVKNKLILLNKIASLDNDPDYWFESIKAHEKVRFQEIEAQIEKAAQNNNDDHVIKLEKELVNTKWKTTPEQHILDKSRKYFEISISNKLQNQIHVLLENISNAHSELDFELLGKYLVTWKSMESSNYFNANEDQKNQYQDALNWWKEESENRNLEINRQELEVKLSNLLEDISVKNIKLTHNEIQRVYNKLIAYDTPINSELARKTQYALDGYQLHKSRKRNAIIVTVGFAICILSGFAFIKIEQRKNDILINKWIVEFDEVITQNDVSAGYKLIDQIRETNNADLSHPEIAKKILEFENVANKVADKAQQFEQIFTVLLANKEMEYFPNDDENILVKKAMSVAITLEQKQNIKEWKMSRSQFIAKHIKDKNIELNNNIVEIINEIKSLETISKESEINYCKKQYIDLKTKAEILSNQRNISSENKDNLEIVYRSLESYNATIIQEIELRENRRTLLKSIYTSLPNFKNYNSALIKFIKLYPNDPASEAYLEVSKMVPYYQSVINKSETPKNGASSIWKETLSKLQNYRDGVVKIKAHYPILLESLTKTKLLSSLRQITQVNKDNTTEVHYYIEDFKITHMAGDYIQIKGKFYNPLYHRIFIDNPSIQGIEDSFKYDGASLVAKNYVPHSRFIRKLPKINNNLESAEIFCLEILNSLTQDKSINEVVKGMLLSKFAGLYQTCSKSNDQEIDKMIEQLSSINFNVYWMNQEDPKTVKTTKDLQSLSSLHPDYSHKINVLKAELELLIKSNVNLSYAGVVSFIEGEPTILSDDLKGVELWSLMIDNNKGTQNFLVIADIINGDYKIREETKDKLYEGQPIFCLRGHITTKNKILNWKKKYYDKSNISGNQVKWPECWPVNERVLTRTK